MFGFKKYIKNFLQMSVRYSQTLLPGWVTDISHVDKYNIVSTNINTVNSVTICP